MHGTLNGRTALITAAAQGIGRATALRFAAERATVWATDINRAALGELEQLNPAIRVRELDVTNAQAVRLLIEGVGRIDVLFNCVGVVTQGSILECEPKDWSFSYEANVTSMFNTCRSVIPQMITQGRGSIINMSSVVSSVKGAPNRFAYGTTKAAVIGLTKSIAADFVARGIRCNALCPGTVDTPSLYDRMKAKGDIEKERAAFIARQPMGRLGTADEIAQAALYLATDASSFMTGQALVIDGGWSI